MQSVLEKKRKKYRELYELLFTDYRIPVHRISERLGFRSVSTVLKEAIDLLYIVGPGARKPSYKNLLEFVYLFKAKNPDIAYAKYREDPRVVYNARIMGDPNSLVISREEIDVKGEIDVEREILRGPRSDYYVPFTPDQSWGQAMEDMREKIGTFDPDSYTPRGYIRNHWNETVKWDNTDEVLYRYFKYNLRKEVGSLIKEQLASKDRVYHWLESVEKRCTIYVHYYPESLLEYDTYFYLFKTEYEDFIIDLFSELPATVTFLKVQDVLLLFAYIPKTFVRDTDPYTAMEPLVPSLEIELLNRGIVRDEIRSIVEYSWGKDL